MNFPKGKERLRGERDGADRCPIPLLFEYRGKRRAGIFAVSPAPSCDNNAKAQYEWAARRHVTRCACGYGEPPRDGIAYLDRPPLSSLTDA